MEWKNGECQSTHGVKAREKWSERRRPKKMREEKTKTEE